MRTVAEELSEALSAAADAAERLPGLLPRLSGSDLEMLMPLLDRAAALTAAGRFSVTAEAVTRGEVASSQAGSVAQWVGERCPSLDAPGAGLVAKAVRELAPVKLAPVREVAVGVVVGSELRALEPLLCPDAVDAVRRSVTKTSGPDRVDLPGSADPTVRQGVPRRRRVDAQRNVDSLLDAARLVFARSGVDAPAKEIADLAGVGVGTLYRHYPRRANLVRAVIEHQMEAHVEAGAALALAHEPGEALTRWLRGYTAFVATKRGLASALHSGDPAFDGLPGYFLQRLGPVLQSLLDAATASGDIRADVSATELLYAMSKLCVPIPDESEGSSQRMVALLVDGLSNSDQTRP